MRHVPSILIAVLFLAPLGLAAADFSDPQGDVAATLAGRPLPPGVECQDARADIVSLTSAVVEGSILLKLAVADGADAPACTVATPAATAPLTPGTVFFEVTLGDDGSDDWVFLSTQLTEPGECFGDLQLAGSFAQLFGGACTWVTTDGATTIRIPALLEDLAGEPGSTFDAGSLPWPRGTVRSFVGDRLPPAGATIVFTDEIDIGSFTPA